MITKYNITFQHQFDEKEQLIYRSMLDLIENDESFKAELDKLMEDVWSYPTEDEVMDLYDIWLQHLEPSPNTKELRDKFRLFLKKHNRSVKEFIEKKDGI